MLHYTINIHANVIKNLENKQSMVTQHYNAH